MEDGSGLRFGSSGWRCLVPHAVGRAAEVINPGILSPLGCCGQYALP